VITECGIGFFVQRFGRQLFGFRSSLFGFFSIQNPQFSLTLLVDREAFAPSVGGLRPSVAAAGTLCKKENHTIFPKTIRLHVTTR
jgi:hypothetical protein